MQRRKPGDKRRLSSKHRRIICAAVARDGDGFVDAAGAFDDLTQLHNHASAAPLVPTAPVLPDPIDVEDARVAGQHPAVQYYYKCVGAPVDTEKVYKTVCTEYMDAGCFDQALAVADERIRTHPDSTGGWVYRARILLKLGRDIDAEIAKILSIDPQHNWVRDLKVNPADRQIQKQADDLATRDWAGALSLLEARISETWDTPEGPDFQLLYQSARLMDKFGDQTYCDTAISYLERACEIDPVDSRSLALLGKFYRRSGDLTKALVFYERDLDCNRRPWVSMSRLASLLLDLNRVEEALSFSQKAVAQYPQKGIGLWTNFRCLRILDRMDEAVVVGRRLLELEPDNVKIKQALAQIDRFTVRKFKTIKPFFNGQFLSPSKLCEKARILLESPDSENIDEARLLLERGAHVYPGDSFILDLLGDLYRRPDVLELDKALQCYIDNLRFHKNPRISYGKICTILLQQQQPERALSFSRQRMSWDLEDVVGLKIHLRCLQACRSDSEVVYNLDNEILETAERILAIYPDNSDAMNAVLDIDDGYQTHDWGFVPGQESDPGYDFVEDRAFD